MDTKDFNFSCPIQLRWNDLDALGHVNSAVYISYFEIARGRFMLASCPTWDWMKDMFIIANIQIDYHKELFLTSEDVQVHVKTSKIGTKSFVLTYALTSQKDGATIVHAVGTTTQVMFDTKTRAKIEIAPELRSALMEFDHL